MAKVDKQFLHYAKTGLYDSHDCLKSILFSSIMFLIQSFNFIFELKLQHKFKLHIDFFLNCAKKFIFMKSWLLFMCDKLKPGLNRNEI